MTANRARTTARWLGEILITLGVVVLLLMVYQLWWTNGQSARAAQVERQELAAEWSGQPTVEPNGSAESAQSPSASTPTPSASADPSIPATPRTVSVPKQGRPFALMYIPRLRDSVWGTPVLQGVSLDELAKGIGHYPGTAMPGEIGNFATAGHRATHGEPFKDFDRLRKGDKVIVETKYGWYTYVLDTDRIVTPRDTWVIEPVPGKPDEVPTEPIITLTTCNPRWASTERWAWWGYLAETRTRDQGPPPALAKGN